MEPPNTRRLSSEILIPNNTGDQIVDIVAERSLHEPSTAAKECILSAKKIDQLRSDALDFWYEPESEELRELIGPDENRLKLFTNRADWIYERTEQQFYYHRLTLVGLKILCPYLGAEIISLAAVGVWWWEKEIGEKVDSFFQPIKVENAFSFSIKDKFHSETIKLMKGLLKITKVAAGAIFYATYRITQLSICSDLSPLPLGFSSKEEGKKGFSLDLRLVAAGYVLIRTYNDRSIALNLWKRMIREEVLNYSIPKKFETALDTICPIKSTMVLFPATLTQCDKNKHWTELNPLIEHFRNGNKDCVSCRKVVSGEEGVTFDVERARYIRQQIIDAHNKTRAPDIVIN